MSLKDKVEHLSKVKASLKELRDKKLEFGLILSNLIRFHWRCRKRRLLKKKKKKKGKKGKKKANKDLMAATMKAPDRRDSLSGAALGSNSPNKGQKVTVKDME